MKTPFKLPFHPGTLYTDNGGRVFAVLGFDHDGQIHLYCPQAKSHIRAWANGDLNTTQLPGDERPRIVSQEVPEIVIDCDAEVKVHDSSEDAAFHIRHRLKGGWTLSGPAMPVAVEGHIHFSTTMVKYL